MDAEEDCVQRNKEWLLQKEKEELLKKREERAHRECIAQKRDKEREDLKGFCQTTRSSSFSIVLFTRNSMSSLYFN